MSRSSWFRRGFVGLSAVAGVFVSGFYAGQKSDAVRVDTPRIPPVKKAEWTDAQRELLEGFESRGRLWNVFTTMANHPDLARDWLVFGGHILSRNTLPPKDRETLILRIGWLCQAEYEWGQHVVIGKRDGLTDEDIERIIEGPTAKGLSDNSRLLLQATDELHKDAFVSDATWNALAEIYNTKQLMDLVFTVGEYNLVSMALNSFGVQLDEGLKGFPE
ncbi:MAG: carboxymuconolactone decarboxylase family protein [Candidatus Hydrogenedentota bacterium]